MTLDLSEVRHVMKLARLAVDDAEVDRLRVDLSAVLDFMERLSSVDVSNVAPMTRGDVAALPAPRRRRAAERRGEAALEHAPARREGHYAVPKVVGGEESP